MMALSREEKEELVLDLYYNRSKTYHEIAKEARISVRDIKPILDKGVHGAQGDQSMSESSKAYKLFSEGKSPLEVAITLNLGEDKVTEFYKYKLYDLNRMYLETKGDIAPIVMMYKLARAEGMNPQHVTKLLTLANNDLPGLENKCENLTIEINSLEEQIQNSQRILRDLNNKITELTSYIGHCQASRRQEEIKLEAIRQQRMKLEVLVRQFENNNEEYLKIKRIAEEKVHSTLSHSKVLLKYSLLSLVESMKKDPDKYCSLIYNDIYSPTLSTTLYASQYHAAFDIHGQHQQYPSQDCYSDGCSDMLLEEAQKVYNNLAKECTERSIDEYTAGTSSLPSLPPASDEKEER